MTLQCLEVNIVPKATGDMTLMYIMYQWHVHPCDGRRGCDTTLSNQAKRLGLGLEVIEEKGWLKTVNFEAKLLGGVALACGVELHLGTWSNKAIFTVVPLIDPDVAVCTEFLR